jgi:hypothetical protein
MVICGGVSFSLEFGGITLLGLTKLLETLTCDFNIGSGDSSLH